MNEKIKTFEGKRIIISLQLTAHRVLDMLANSHRPYM